VCLNAQSTLLIRNLASPFEFSHASQARIYYLGHRLSVLPAISSGVLSAFNLHSRVRANASAFLLVPLSKMSRSASCRFAYTFSIETFPMKANDNPHRATVKHATFICRYNAFMLGHDCPTAVAHQLL
jgi:hypothetical protein